MNYIYCCFMYYNLAWW